MSHRRNPTIFACILLITSPALASVARADQPLPGETANAAIDLYGDLLPPHAVLRLGTTRFHHGSFICDAAISPDGRMLASAAANQDVGIALWEIPSGRLLRRLTSAGDKPPWTYDLAFSPDGKKLLTGDVRGTVHLWDVASGDEIYSIAAHSGYPGATAVAFSRDGRWIASGGADCVVRVWSADGGRELLSFDMLGQPQENHPRGGYGGPPAIAALAFSPDGRLLAAGISRSPSQPQTGKIRVWDVEANQPVNWLDDRQGELESIVFTPDGRQLMSGGNITIPREKFGRPYPYPQAYVVQTRVWDVANGKMVRELATPQPEIGSGALALSDDGRTLAVGYEYKISIWDVDSARIRRSIDVPPDWRGGRGLAISADGLTVGAPRGSHAMGLWSTTTGDLLSPKSDSHSSAVVAVAYADGGRSIVTAGGDAAVRVWNAADGRQRWARTLPRTAYVHVMAVSPDGAWVGAAGSADVPEAGVRILRTATGELVRFIPMFEKQFQRQVHALAFSPDSRRVAIAHDPFKASDDAIGLYDVATGEKRAAIAFEAMLRYPYAMVFSQDSASLYTVHDSAAVNIWDTATGKRRRQFSALKPPPAAPDGKRKEVRFVGAEPRIAWAAFAPDLKTLVTSQGRELLTWDVQRGELAATMPSESADEGGSIAISGNGRRLVMVDRHFSGSDALRVFDLSSRRVIARFDSGQGRPRCVAFSPDNTRLVTGMENGTALVWDLGD